MAVKTANQQILEAFLGVNGTANLGTGSAAGAQSTALNGWNLAGALIAPVSDGAGGGSLPAALQKLTTVWQGPAADEFVKQTGKLATFGSGVTAKVSGQSTAGNAAAVADAHGYTVTGDSSNWPFSVENIQGIYGFAATQHAGVSGQFDDWGNQISNAVNNMLGQSVNPIFPQAPKTTITVGNHVADILGDQYTWTRGGSGKFATSSGKVSTVTVTTNGWTTVDGKSISSTKTAISDKVDSDWVKSTLADQFDAEFGDLVNYVRTSYAGQKAQLPNPVDQSILPTASAPSQAYVPGGGNGLGGAGVGGLGAGGGAAGGVGKFPGSGLGATNQSGTGKFPGLPVATKTPPTYTLPTTPPGSQSGLPGPGSGTGSFPGSGTGGLPGDGSTGGLPGSGSSSGTGSFPGNGDGGLGTGGSGTSSFPGGGSNPLGGTQTAGYDPEQAPGFTAGLQGPGAGGATSGVSSFGKLPGGAGLGAGGGLGTGGLGVGGLGTGGLGTTGPGASGGLASGGATGIGPNGQGLAAAEQAATEAGAAGAAGRMPMMPPMAPMGMGNGDSDRQRKAWLPEEEDLWGVGETAGLGPAVLGGEG